MRTTKYRLVLLFLISMIGIASCAEKEPVTPLKTLQTYQKALKQKDTATLKLLLSAETIKMHEQEARSQGVSVDEIIQRETLFSDSQRSVDFRNQSIEGDKATLEVKNAFGVWETIPFVKEDGDWKIDKKGYADRMMQEIEQNNQKLDQLIDEGRQP